MGSSSTRVEARGSLLKSASRPSSGGVTPEAKCTPSALSVSSSTGFSGSRRRSSIEIALSATRPKAFVIAFEKITTKLANQGFRNVVSTGSQTLLQGVAIRTFVRKAYEPPPRRDRAAQAMESAVVRLMLATTGQRWLPRENCDDGLSINKPDASASSHGTKKARENYEGRLNDGKLSCRRS